MWPLQSTLLGRHKRMSRSCKVVAASVVIVLLMLGETVSAFSGNNSHCSCSRVRCSLKDSSSCNVTKNSTCGGYYTRQLPDGPLLSRSGGAENVSVSDSVSVAEGRQTVNITVTWTQPTAKGYPVSQYEVALSAYTTATRALAGFKEYYIVSEPPPASDQDWLSVWLTCSCDAAVSWLTVTVTSFIGPVDQCDFRQTRVTKSLDGANVLQHPVSVTYTPDGNSSDSSTLVSGTFTPSERPEQFGNTFRKMSCTKDGFVVSILKPPTTFHVSDVITVRDQEVCTPYWLAVDFPGQDNDDFQKQIVYMLPDVSNIWDKDQKPKPESSRSSSLLSLLSPSPTSLTPSTSTKLSLSPSPSSSSSSTKSSSSPSASSSSLKSSLPSLASSSSLKSSLPSPASSSSLKSSLSPSSSSLAPVSYALPRRFSPSSASSFESTNGVIVTFRVGRSAQATSETPSETGETTTPSVRDSTAASTGRMAEAAAFGTNVTRSGTEGYEDGHTSTSNKSMDSAGGEKASQPSQSDSSAHSDNITLIVEVGVTGVLTLAAIIALTLAFRQLYRRATFRHEFRPVSNSPSKFGQSDPSPETRSQTSVEFMESPTDCPLRTTRSPLPTVTFTSPAEDVLIIYHEDDELHVRKVKDFKRDLAQKLDQNVVLRDIALSDLSDTGDARKVILVLSAGIKNILDGPRRDELKQLIHDQVFQRGNHYFLVLLTRHGDVSRHDVRWLTASFAEVERTFEITGPDCEQLHSLAQEILKDGDLTNSEYAAVLESRSFEPPLSCNDVPSVDISGHLHAINDVNDTWTVHHGIA